MWLHHRRCAAVFMLMLLAGCAVSRVVPINTGRGRGQVALDGSDFDVKGCLVNLDRLESGKSYPVRGATPTVPVSFSRVEKGDDDEYHIGAAISLGYGYTWYRGRGAYSSGGAEAVAKALKAYAADPSKPPVIDPVEGQMVVDPGLFWGIAASAGGRNEGNSIGESFNLALFAGVRDVAFTGGYDLLGKTPFFGVSAKIDALTFRRGSGEDLCIRRPF